MSALPADDAIVCWRDGPKSIFLQLFLQKWVNERYLEPRKENGQKQVNSLYQDGQTNNSISGSCTDGILVQCSDGDWMPGVCRFLTSHNWMKGVGKSK